MPDLARRPKGDARKVRIAERLRRETTMTLAWIGDRLYMGAPGHVSCLLYRKEGNQRQAEDENSENKWLTPLWLISSGMVVGFSGLARQPIKT